MSVFREEQLSKFLKTFIPTFVVGILLLSGIFQIFNTSQPEPLDQETLIKEARAALVAVKNRKSSDRHPASYDSIMSPLDKLLSQTKSTLESVDYNPINDFSKVEKSCNAVYEIAIAANDLSQTEKGLARKTYRFPYQASESCEYLAIALWQRLESQISSTSSDSDLLASQVSGSYISSELKNIHSTIDRGLKLKPDNKWLLYLAGVVDRSLGSFASAAKYYKLALDVDPDFSLAWNDLGLTYIDLRDFSQAEAALERAKELSYSNTASLDLPPGVDYLTVLYNLGKFHEGLASYYDRELRLNQTPELKADFIKHRNLAKQYFSEYLQYSSPDSPDTKQVKRLLDNLNF